MIGDLQISTLYPICPGARLVLDGPRQYVYLPGLKVSVGDSTKAIDALLSPSEHTGYSTRLFLSEPILERPTIGGKPANWTAHSILARAWHSWSWQGVSAELPLVQMLLTHIRALK